MNAVILHASRRFVGSAFPTSLLRPSVNLGNLFRYVSSSKRIHRNALTNTTKEMAKERQPSAQLQWFRRFNVKN